jgi:phosphoglycerate dehydrogenase-like enzyme
MDAPSDPWRVLSLTPAAPERVRGWFEGLAGLDLRFPSERDSPAVLEAIAGADVVLSDWSGALRVGRDEIGRAPCLAFVMSAAVGVDSLDMAALTEAGVVVATPAGLNARSVAEWCLGAALAVARSLVWVDTRVRDGGWPQLELPERGSMELHGRRVGVVGFGAVGSRTARLFDAIGCKVSYWTRTPRSPTESGSATWCSLDDLLDRSEILVVNLSLTDETRGLLDAARLTRLPQGAIVVDASRGGIVDHAAVAAMVDSGRLHGAAIDVFDVEPLPADSLIRGSDRILLSSHAAATTREAVARIFGLVRSNIERAIAGQPVESVINGLDPVIRRRVVVR